jgi:hypothetical protein
MTLAKRFAALPKALQEWAISNLGAFGEHGYCGKHWAYAFCSKYDRWEVQFLDVTGPRIIVGPAANRLAAAELIAADMAERGATDGP